MAEHDKTSRPVPLPGIGRSRQVTFRRRWSLRSQGRLDGRLGRPDPLVLSGPVVSDVRKALLADLDRAAAIVRQEFIADVRELRERISGIEGELVTQTDLTARADDEAAAAQQEQPDPDAPPRRRPGDEYQPEDVVRARRARDHAARLTTARGKATASREKAAALREKRAELLARVDERHQLAVALVEESRALVLAQQAIYEQTLLRRHPEGELLRCLLETNEPDLPLWTTDPSHEDPLWSDDDPA